MVEARFSFSTTATNGMKKKTTVAATQWVSVNGGQEKMCIRKYSIRRSICRNLCLLNANKQRCFSVLNVYSLDCHPNPTNLIGENSMRRIMREFRAGIMCTLNISPAKTVTIELSWIHLSLSWLGMRGDSVFISLVLRIDNAINTSHDNSARQWLRENSALIDKHSSFDGIFNARLTLVSCSAHSQINKPLELICSMEKENEKKNQYNKHINIMRCRNVASSWLYPWDFDTINSPKCMMVTMESYTDSDRRKITGLQKHLWP